MSPPNPDDLDADLRAYVQGRRDSKRELEFLRRLRALPPKERSALLLPLLEFKTAAVFALIHRAQLPRASYLEVFKRGQAEPKASSIKYWMDATIPHIGWLRAFSVLRKSMATNPRTGALALYYVPWVCRSRGQLSGPLPTRELTVECLRLILRYHENGHRVVDDRTLARFKKIVSGQE